MLTSPVPSAGRAAPTSSPLSGSGRSKELYDLKADPGETKNVIADHPEVAAKLSAAYDEWWTATRPLMVNEDAVGPKINPLKELYWKQFGGGPDEAMLKRMDPTGKFKAAEKSKTPRKKAREDRKKKEE